MSRHLVPNPENDPYAGHVVHVLVENEAVQVYDLRSADGSNINQVSITFGPNGIGISGDLAPGRDGDGVWSRNVGARGCREWFMVASSRDYLAGKFLRQHWTADQARAEIRAEIDGETDRDRIDLLVAEVLEAPWEQEHELYDAMQRAGCDTADGVYGYAYREHDIDLLVSLQARLRRFLVERVLVEQQDDGAVLEEALMAARAGAIGPRVIRLMAAEIDRLGALVTEAQRVVSQQSAHLRAQTRSVAQLLYGRFNLVAGWYVLEVAEEYRPDRGRWHRQNPDDYTDRLDWAGVFTRDEVASYHNGKGPTTAVPVEQVLMEFEGPTALLRARIVERSNEIDSAGIPRANSLPGVAVELADFLQGAARRARSQAASTSEPEVRTLALAESIRLAGWARSLTDALRAGTYTHTSTPDQP